MLIMMLVISVCVCVVCVSVCVLIYASMRVPLYVEVRGQPWELSVLFFETLSVTGLGLTIDPLSLKCVPLCSAFCFEFRGLNLGFRASLMRMLRTLTELLPQPWNLLFSPLQWNLCNRF